MDKLGAQKHKCPLPFSYINATIAAPTVQYSTVSQLFYKYTTTVVVVFNSIVVGVCVGSYHTVVLPFDVSLFVVVVVVVP